MGKGEGKKIIRDEVVGRGISRKREIHR